MWRRLIGILAVGASAPLIALAASVVLTSNGLGAGSASSPRCVSADVSVIQNLSGSNVASVTVGSLPAGCGGATLYVTLNNGSTSGGGSTTVPAGGGSATVTLGSAPAAATVEQIDLVLAGP
jgi:hypothetical protein